MIWALVCVAGLLAETCLIVVLGLSATGPTEEDSPAEDGGPPEEGSPAEAGSPAEEGDVVGRRA